MIILSIDTSCDDTSASVTDNLTVLSNVVWSQSKIHAKYGGVFPSEARRQHERKISWVVNKSVNTAKITYKTLDAISVTVGPGLAIALGVGIAYAKKISEKYNKPLIAINHLEGHLLSSLAKTNSKSKNPPGSDTLLGRRQNTKTDFDKIKEMFPAFGMVVSGGNTLLVLIENIGKYKILSQTIDDALGESLDKSARLLGLGYPGGAILEKFAKAGDFKKYPLPLPMLGREDEGQYSYSGIKSAFSRLYGELLQQDKISIDTITDLAASYQFTAFEHFIRITKRSIEKYSNPNIKFLFVGGGVAANVELKNRIRSMCKNYSITPLFPYNKKLNGDNAAMIGIAAYYKYLKRDFTNPQTIDRLPNLKIDQKI